MENFKKPLIDEKPDAPDSYIEDLERKLNVKRATGLLSSNFDKDYYKNLDIGNQKMSMALYRAKYILFYWGVLLGVVTNSLAIYPISVKIVRKMFKLTGFYNIHFAIIPIILNWNALVLGVGEGLYTYYTLKR